ncbi:hypothetical protein, partial [Streptomyces nigra]
RQAQREEERRVRDASKWPCPSCGNDVYPDPEAGLAPGSGECGVCRSRRARLAQEAEEQAEAEAEALACASA